VTGKRWPRCFWLYARWPDRDGHVAKPVLGGRLKGERDPLSCLETAIAIHDDHGEVRPATSGGLCRVDYAESLVGTPLSNRSFGGHAASMTFRSVDSCAGVRPRSDRSVISGSSLPVVQAGPDHPKVVHPRGSQRGSQPHAARAGLMVFKNIRDSVLAAAPTRAFSMAACNATQDHPVNILCSQRWPFSSRTVGTVEWLTGWSRSFGRWRLLRIASMRAGCCTWLLYGLAVRLSSVSLDHPQPTCRQRCLKRAQVPLANIKNVWLAADANSDCGGGMARRPVEDAVLSAHVAGGDHHASSRLGHDRKDSRHHLIRRSRHFVQDRLLRSLRWADIPQLPAWDAPCPAAWQQCWQQSRRPGADPRPSAFQVAPSLAPIR
jgi:hypothetical protein